MYKTIRRRGQPVEKMMRRVYLDHNATTAMSAEVCAAMETASRLYGNASSMHAEGRAARRAIEEARENVIKLINGDGAVFFTSGGSEANNTVLESFADRDGQVVVSAVEHPCVIESAKRLERRGKEVVYLPVAADGRANLSMLKRILRKKTALVSVMLANNELGTIQDVQKVTELAHGAGALVHTDAVQAIGRIKVDAVALGVDFLTLSAHKFRGPKGVGALYARKGAQFSPLIVGGHQENGLRAGTSNTPGIVGMGRAAELARKMPSLYHDKVVPLRDELRGQIVERIPNVTINGSQEYILPNTLNVSFAGAEGESILLALDQCGIAVSTGSACASGDAAPSHVLMAIRADPELAHGSIRFGLGLENSRRDVQRVLDVLPGIVEKLRAMSTVVVEAER